MSRTPAMLTAALAAILLLAPGAARAQASEELAIGFGTPLKPADLKEFFSIPPDGAGLPDGSGIASQGEEVYASACAMCHGQKLEGIHATGAPALAGGRGTLKDVPPLKTVESYWPYATTLFDYVKRAMPFHAPGSLTDDQVYAVTAYILHVDGIIEEDEVMDKDTLPKVKMPNADGFVTYKAPDLRLYK
ncbi:Cytochrome c [Methyloligella halotolerans]|uniref:Cytochrome c n=1 Tax=Methyloligella halotolerans TaxID=1177755 RepID=A0A1E2RXT6_9HYPH|nr:cytochrome c [Methyloligella halotolerans]ODA67033.1 Cytochrome c [Methyloligella halotolerans]